MAKEKTYMPQGTAGLVRYFDEEGGIKISPQSVVYMTLGFITLVMVVKFVAA